MLEACDHYGMYMMDESFDMWFNRKTKFDYGLDFEEHWAEDTAKMVQKDYNHPCVILYSIGNEVADPAQAKGLEYDGVLVVSPDEIIAEAPGGARVLYVALTRATQMMITLDVDTSDWRQLLN